jgi:4-amino-4-deoxy-L-arabinose transferase-like glycosyltransferase
VTGRATRLWAIGPGLVVAAAALVFTRALDTRTNYDEGVYLASLDALRRGQELGSDVYTSQPPGFYWVLRLLAAPFGTSVEGIRIGFAAVAVAGVAAAITLCWRLYGPPAGVLAGALVVIGPPYPSVAPTVAADVPSVGLGLVSLALLAFALPDGAPRRWSAAAGATLSFAVATKLLAFPFVVPFLALTLARRAGRRVLPTAAAGAAIVVAVLALVHAGSLGAIWDSVVGDHTGAAELGDRRENVRWIRDLLEPRTPIAWLVPAGLVAFVLSRSARRTWPLWTFVPAAALFLVLLRPLADHHLLLLTVAYAISAGPSLALGIAALGSQRLRIAAAGVVTLFVLAGVYQEQRRLHRNDVPEPAEITWAATALERVTPPDAVVVSDQPIVPFLARRAQPGRLVDTSNTRITGGGLTADEVIDELERAHPEAVVVARMLGTLPAVLAYLQKLYPHRAGCGEATLYLRAGAAAPPRCPVG